MAPQQAAYPTGSIARNRASNAATRASPRNAGVNHRSITAPPMAPIPSARTSAARSAHPEGRCAAVAISTSPCTRSGRRIASACAVIPPSDNPTTCARPTPNPSSSPAKSSARSSIDTGASRTADRPCPRVSYRNTR